MESPGSNSAQGSSARVIQETPNSQSDQSSVSYKDWKKPSHSIDNSPLPRGTHCLLQARAQFCTNRAAILSFSDTVYLRYCLCCSTGAISFSTPAQSLSALPGTMTDVWQTPPMPSAECFNETPPHSDMPPNWQAAHADIGSFTPHGMVGLPSAFVSASTVRRPSPKIVAHRRSCRRHTCLHDRNLFPWPDQQIYSQ